MAAGISASSRTEARVPLGAVAGVPALQGAQPDTGVPGQGGERDLVLDVKPEDLPAPGRVHDLHGASRLSWFLLRDGQLDRPQPLRGRTTER